MPTPRKGSKRSSSEEKKPSSKKRASGEKRSSTKSSRSSDVSGREKAKSSSRKKSSRDLGNRRESGRSSRNRASTAEQSGTNPFIYVVIGLLVLSVGGIGVYMNMGGDEKEPSDTTEISKPNNHNKNNNHNNSGSGLDVYSKLSDAPKDAELYQNKRSKEYVDVKNLSSGLKTRITKNKTVWKKVSR
jgi:hypothetical protein